MKKWFLSVLVVFSVLFLTGCSSPSENKYTPQIINRGGLLTDSLQQQFVSFDYPAGCIPVMVLENSIEDPLKTSAHGDDVFDEISEERDADNFDDYGLLIYITNEPRLIQMRLGDHYNTYANLCGITSGQRYLELQQKFADQGSDGALGEMLSMVCQNVVKRNNLSWWQRGQLSNVVIAINNTMDWFGTPSQNLYGTIVAKPVYVCISYGNKLFGSWIWGIVLVFIVIIGVRWLITSLIKSIIRSQRLRSFLTGIFSTALSLIYSISAAGCSMYFSSGRLEDLYAIKAFGIPNVEAYISDPSMFVQENNFWIAGLFVFVTTFAICLSTLCSDIILFSTEPIDKQMAVWSSLSKNQRDWVLGLNENPEIKPGETPYQAIATKKIEKLGEQLGTVLGGLAIGALFFFPKAILWTGIAFAIAKMISKIPRCKTLLSRRLSNHESGGHVLGSFVVLMLAFTVGEIALSWFIDPFNQKEDTPVVQQLAPIYKKAIVTAKTANLRTGPGTNYDFATINNNGVVEKWQVICGTELDVISEQDGWYKVRIGNNPQEVYIKQSLCKDDINVGLYGSLPSGESHYVGNMAGFPIEFTITKNKKTGRISAVYKNVNYKTIMNLKGETKAEQMGIITFYGKENKREWIFSLSGDNNHISGTAEGDNKELTIELLPK